MPLHGTIADAGLRSAAGAPIVVDGHVWLADRLAALDGQLRVESPADGGTLVAADIPLPEVAPAVRSSARLRSADPDVDRVHAPSGQREEVQRRPASRLPTVQNVGPSKERQRTGRSITRFAGHVPILASSRQPFRKSVPLTRSACSP
jgi:hypothetical protein